MKKIVFLINDMGIGGIPSALVNFLKLINNIFDISLICPKNNGEYFNDLPKNIKIYHYPYHNIDDTYNKIKKQKGILFAVYIKLKYIYYDLLRKRIKQNILLAKNNDLLIDEEFDCAVAYHGMSRFELTRTLYNIKAKKKIAWIHGDHNFYKTINDAYYLYKQFNLIYCVSKKVLNDFSKSFNKLTNLDVFYNILNTEKIINLSNEKTDDFKNDKINIVTVGRISKEKGQDLIPYIAKKLTENEYNINWLIVGDGEDRKRIEDLTNELRMKKYIKFVGSKQNPYSYMKNCDLYIQPSYSEGYGLTIIEAAILGKPIIATDVCGIKEHLNSNMDYIEAEPNIDSIFNSIKILIDNPVKTEQLKYNLYNRDFTNKNEINKFIDFVK